VAFSTPTEIIPSTSTGVGFYYWFNFYFNTTQYTGNPAYQNVCGKEGATNTRDYITSNGGNMVTYAHFTENQYLAERAFGGGTYKAAGDLMINNAYTAAGPATEWIQDGMRQVAWSLKDCIAIIKYGSVSCPNHQKLRDAAITILLSMTETPSNSYRWVQGYLGGYGVDALIEDWPLSHDPRIPYVIKRYNDYIYANVVNHVFMNVPYADGSPGCSDTPQYLWIQPDQQGNCGVNAANYQHLGGMVATEAFYWYYAYTGDTTYRDEGDDLFSHAWDTDPEDGKSASQDYSVSFNSVALRTGAQTVEHYYGDLISTSPGVLNGKSVVSGRVVLQ